MYRMAVFIDGSNLDGMLKRMALQVADYGAFFKFIVDKSIETWRSAISAGHLEPVLLQRIYWYRVGSIDDWNLNDPKVVEHIRSLFDRSPYHKRNYMALAGQKLKDQPQGKIFQEAWATCFAELKEWYNARCRHVESMKRFYHSVKSETDFLEIIPCGHWKVDLLGHRITEKGLDTRLAVDMITKLDSYDIALMVCGDADSIPSISEAKMQGRHVGTIEFLSGYPPEKKGGGFSSKLRAETDFVTPVYEMELVQQGLGTKASATETDEHE